MDRCAVFVDAGHLLAEGGKLCCGTPDRKRFRCDYGRLLTALLQFASMHCQLPVLRLYWYDAAPDAIPTQEQLTIAELPNVKLRLGRLVSGEQKGVDSLIVRDLMTLARERAASTIFLLGGDEDLREGVVAAQEFGVLVVVLGIPTNGRGNQAKSLIRDADEHIVLDPEFLSPAFTRVENGFRDSTSEGQTPSQSSVTKGAKLIGQEFAASWAKLATPEELRQLLGTAPVIPVPLDIQLVSAAEQTLGSLHERQDLKKKLRAGFWRALRQLGKPSV